MCFYCRCEVIAQCTEGQVLRDWEKKNYSIQFGNVDMMFDTSQFRYFTKFVNSLTNKDLMEMTNMRSNRIVLKQKKLMGGYSFEPTEFFTFRDLMNEVMGVIVMEEEVKGILGL